MKCIQLNKRGLVSAVSTAAFVLGVGIPTFAATRYYNDDNGYNYRYNNGNNSYRYNNNYGNRFVGTIGRVDTGAQQFRLYLNNGQSYHVNAGGATILLNGQNVPFDQLPTSGTVRVVGTMDNNGNINATEVDFGNGSYGNGGYYGNGGNNNGYRYGGNSGYNNRRWNGGPGYNNGYNNGAGFVGTIGRVDTGAQQFRLYLNTGQSYHVNAGGATILVNGQNVPFSTLPSSGTVRVIGTLDNNNSINATEVDFGTGAYGNGGYNNGGYNNGGYNNGYRNRRWRDNNGYGYGNNGNHYGWRNHRDNNDYDNDGD
jgi:hypothetical protein